MELRLAECGLPKTPARQQVRVLADLRLGIQAAAGVVEVDVAVAVEPAVVGVRAAGRSRWSIGTRDVARRTRRALRPRSSLDGIHGPPPTCAAIVLLATGSRSRSAGRRRAPSSIRRIESGAQIWLTPVEVKPNGNVHRFEMDPEDTSEPVRCAVQCQRGVGHAEGNDRRTPLLVDIFTGELDGSAAGPDIQRGEDAESMRLRPTYVRPPDVCPPVKQPAADGLRR